MENLIFLLHLLTAFAIIGLILLQQGKGAEMGASFGGGASQTLFGASGSGNFFSKLTAVFAFVFFVTSFSLAVIAKQNASIEEGLPPALIETVDDVPQVDAATLEDDIPELAPGSDGQDVPQIPDEEQ